MKKTKANANGTPFRRTFSKFSKWVSAKTGHPISFIIALLIIIAWAISGPYYHFSDTWQLIINTGTTVVTFLMVFIIHNAQNRDMLAVQIKLDEVIRAIEGAHNTLLDIEQLTDQEIELLYLRYVELSKKAKQALCEGKSDTDIPSLD